jgi:hypothetical protein
MKEKGVFIIVAVLYLATVFALVRPGSKGTQLVTTIFSTLSDLVRGVSGQTYNANTQKWSAGNG